MHALLTLALLLDLVLPKEAKDLEGMYVIRSGFENVTVELKTGGAMVLTQRFDHPGENKWSGDWTYEKQKITVSTRYTQAGEAKVKKETWVPLVWGDRLMIVDEGELKAGIVAERLRLEAKRANELGKRDETETRMTKFAVRVKKQDDKLPHRYGKILAPKEYEKMFEGIELLLPK